MWRPQRGPDLTELSFPPVDVYSLIGMTSGSQFGGGTKENADLGIVVQVDVINDTFESASAAPPVIQG